MLRVCLDFGNNDGEGKSWIANFEDPENIYASHRLLLNYVTGKLDFCTLLPCNRFFLGFADEKSHTLFSVSQVNYYFWEKRVSINVKLCFAKILPPIWIGGSCKTNKFPLESPFSLSAS